MDSSSTVSARQPETEGLSGEQVLSSVRLYVLVMGAAFLLIYLLDRFLKIPIEASFSWALLLVAIILNRYPSVQNAPGRFLFIFTVAVISLRYLLWRTFDTLIYTGWFDLIGMMLVYLAECYSLIIHFLGMFISMWPLESKPVALPDDPSVYPVVDILIPTFTESEEIVRLTVAAATQLDYPKDKYRVYILDDGSTDARRSNPETSMAAWQRYYKMRRIARDMEAQYLTRENNDRAKAGNINHALTKVKGDLLLLLDCDHVPARDILQNTVGWFLKDPKLFLVQTPHFFINTTTVEKNIGSFSNAPGENDMFYHAIQPGMDLWNSSYFCGSAALLKRQFLVDAGGIAGETITEDAETSLRLHNKGYNSVYISRPMICGLSPETFGDYIVQRTRWAQGMVALGFWGFAVRLFGHLYEATWLQRAAVVMGPAGFAAVLAGWITTEVGRQPWTVYGQLTTAQSVSPLEAPAVGASLLAFVLVYFAVFGTGTLYALRLMAHPPQARIEEDLGPTRAAGITPGAGLAEPRRGE